MIAKILDVAQKMNSTFLNFKKVESSFGSLKLKMKSWFQFKKNQNILTKLEISNECILTFAILSKVSQEYSMKFYNFDTKIEYQK